MRVYVFQALALLGLFTIRSVSANAIVTVLNSSPWTYRARVAAFGDQVEVGVMNYANLMLPPHKEDPFLCQDPDIESLNLSVASLIDGPPTRDVALFVSRGECSFEKKARNALKIQQNTTSHLRYVIVYNNDHAFPKDVLVMSASSSEEELEDLSDLTLIFVSTNTGSTVLREISQHSDSVQESPYFLQENSEGWDMPILVEKLPPAEETGEQSGPPFGSLSSSGGNGGGSGGRNVFYWLRFVLFALLIVAPCFRAIYLWYSGGGRVLVRRDENGRIIGFTYVRPIPYWFAGGAATTATDDTVVDRLTKEQFLELPIIEYKPPSSDTAIEGREMQVDTEEAIEANESDVENAENDLAGSCTMCSICIDDFEEGEQLRLLPRCRHAFHTDCIMPWLTERQGCCPLCKTNVLQEEDPATDEADTDVEASSHEDDSEA